MLFCGNFDSARAGLFDRFFGPSSDEKLSDKKVLKGQELKIDKKQSTSAERRPNEGKRLEQKIVNFGSAGKQPQRLTGPGLADQKNNPRKFGSK